MTSQPYTQEEANQFIIECHFDLDAVKRKLKEKPELINAYNQETIESALGASGHMGREDIAEFLLSKGAEMELATAAMLGRRELIAKALEQDRANARKGGAHNIPIAFHAALSGDVELMQILWDAGAEEDAKGSLLGAVMKNRVEMARWLLDHGTSKEVKTFDGKSPLQLADELGYIEIKELLQT
ncbi:MAG: ankyrin repeat domain-containing protein [Anaerolineales bacterium]